MPDKIPLSSDSIVFRNAEVVDAKIDGEVVAMNMDSGTCYGLNMVGSRIWDLLGDRIHVSEVCARLRAEFEVEPDVCERQVLALLAELHSEKLISILQEK